MIAVGHPVRIEILRRLLTERVSAVRLTGVLDVELSNASYHLCRVLFDRCELVEIVERHPRRGSEEKVFRLKPDFRWGVVSVLRFIDGATLEQDVPPQLQTWAELSISREGRDLIHEAAGEFAIAVDRIRAQHGVMPEGQESTPSYRVIAICALLDAHGADSGCA